jgi:hypothetical protein
MAPSERLDKNPYAHKKGIPRMRLTFRAPDRDTQIRIHGNSTYTPELANYICEQIMLKKALTKICEDPRMPNLHTVVRWLADPKRIDFREQYYYARRVAAELYVDEIFTIADDSSNDWKPKFNDKGDLVDYVPDNEAIQRSRVRIDARKWYASKMVPRIYGDKVDVDLNATGDLAEMLKRATNNDAGLPKPIEHDDSK